jgi:hypothetical protein
MPRAATNISSAQSIRHRAKLRSDDQQGETSGEGAPEQFAQRVSPKTYSKDGCMA